MTTLICQVEGAGPSEISIEAGARHAVRDRPAAGRFTLYDERISELHPAAIPVGPQLAIAAGEQAKTFATLERILRELTRAGIDRSGSLVVIGGGTIGDVGGLAAALHLRGIALEHVPTTLLAMVDSSVGGKTAINLPEGKNLVGAFWSPRRVVVDPEFVATLPEAEFRSGLGEVLKSAIGLDASLFDLCESRSAAILAREPGALAAVIEIALRAKIRIVEADFRESGARRVLNLGHTLGHALEAASNFTTPHGVAVARGVHYAIDLAERRNVIARSDVARCRTLLERFGFIATPLPPRSALLAFLQRDKKRHGDAIEAVLPTGIGNCETQAMDLAEFAAALE